RSSRAPDRERASSPVAASEGAAAAPAAEGGAEASAPRPPRPPREPRQASVQAEPGQVRLWVNLGKSDKVEDEGSLRSALEGAGAPAGKIAKTELRGTYSYVFVAEGDAGDFESLAGKQLGEKALKIEKAKR
ncbi:MAG: DbpA RNA binding domain-containing protein, partial [Myxococcota bacterium]|nr:DbpA RNA binding domain-containing protein [Myxococcota bacterium]